MGNNPFNWKVGDIVVCTKPRDWHARKGKIVGIDNKFKGANYEIAWYEGVYDRGHWENSILTNHGVIVLQTDLERFLYGVSSNID